MSRKAEARYGSARSYRKRLKGPDGKYHDVYGRTIAERDLAVAELRASWAAEEKIAADPFVWQYAAAWFARDTAGKSERQRETVADQLNRVICPVIGQRRMGEITADDLADVMATRAHLSRGAQEKTTQVLKRLFAAAAESDVIRKNPASKLQPGGKRAKKKDALTRAQEETLLEAVTGCPVWLFIMLGLYTGMRREEIVGLQWDCVELGDVPSVTVRRACRWIKNNQPEISDDLKSDAAARTVPIPPQLADALRAAKAAAKLPENVLRGRTVITKTDGTPWSYSSYTKAWHAVEARSTGTVQRKRKDPVTGETVTVEEVKRLGDKIRNHNAVVSIDFKVTPHVLRHTYITRLILGRVPLKRVQYLAGHADPKVTIKIYTDLMGHAPEDLAGDINAVFAPAQTPPKTPLTPPEAP